MPADAFTRTLNGVLSTTTARVLDVIAEEFEYGACRDDLMTGAAFGAILRAAADQVRAASSGHPQTETRDVVRAIRSRPRLHCLRCGDPFATQADLEAHDCRENPL